MIIDLCVCEAANLVLRTDGTLYRFAPHTEPARAIAWDRDESDMCQKSTPGCSIDHNDPDEVARAESDCDTW